MQKYNQKIDLIIPAYNSAHLIFNAIESALLQKHLLNQILIIDDGSTDNIEDVVSKLASNRTDIIRFISQSNKGPAAARNRGISESSGNLIAFLDADDIWLPGRLNNTFYFLNNGNFDWVATGFYKQFPDGKREYRSLPEQFGIWDRNTGEVDLLKKGLIFFSFLPIITGTLLFKREVLEKLNGFDERFYVGEDWDLYLRAAESGFRLGFLDEPTAVYNYVPTSLTKGKKFDGIKEHLKVARNHADLNGLPSTMARSSYAEFIWNAGLTYWYRKDIYKALKCFAKSMLVSPNSSRIVSILNRLRNYYI